MADAATLYEGARRKLPYTPMPGQQQVLADLCSFAAAHGERDVYVLNGYAGTGKTSLVGALMTVMAEHKMRTTVLAPTGRAAKVAEKYSTRHASTVHRHIYRPEGDNAVAPAYVLGHNNTRDTLYIIDEASMVTDAGSRSMLRDLVRFIYSAPGCAMVLVGDIAQLPPVGQPDSPAMNGEVLASLGLRPYFGSLTEPARQSAESGILVNATEVRRHIGTGDLSMPRLTARGFADVTVVPFTDLADTLSSSWSAVGQEETIIITRSNRRANMINAAVRQEIMYADEPLTRGERLIISKNNYFWTREMRPKTFLANGETVILDWTSHSRRVHGFRFVDAELRVPGRDDIIGATILLDSLNAQGPSLSQEELNRLYKSIFATKEGQFTEKTMATLEDEYYNALQVKYAYCVTCHKAQGGQWKHVYIDLSALMLDAVDESFFRWLYTALTRASERIFLIHPSIPVQQ